MAPSLLFIKAEVVYETGRGVPVFDEAFQKTALGKEVEMRITRNAGQWLVRAGMILCLGWLLTGCATSGQLASVREYAREAGQKADAAMEEAEEAKAMVSNESAKAEAAASRAEDAADRSELAAERAEQAAGQAEQAARRAERAADQAEAMAKKCERIFMQKMRK
jgi:hypothetical protein